VPAGLQWRNQQVEIGSKRRLEISVCDEMRCPSMARSSVVDDYLRPRAGDNELWRLPSWGSPSSRAIARFGEKIARPAVTFTSISCGMGALS